MFLKTSAALYGLQILFKASPLLQNDIPIISSPSLPGKKSEDTLTSERAKDIPSRRASPPHCVTFTDDTKLNNGIPTTIQKLTSYTETSQRNRGHLLQNRITALKSGVKIEEVPLPPFSPGIPGLISPYPQENFAVTPPVPPLRDSRRSMEN